MYIHSTPAAVNEMPQANNHQLVSSLPKYIHVQLNEGIASIAIFSSTCPAHRQKAWIKAKRISCSISVNFAKVYKGTKNYPYLQIFD